jgi:hypothetical protein
MPSAEEAKTPAILDAVVDRETLPAGKCDLRGITGLALPTILLTPTTLFDVLNTDHLPSADTNVRNRRRSLRSEDEG